MTPEQRERFLPPFLADDRYHLALAEHEPESDGALGVELPPPRRDRRRAQDDGGAQRQRDWVINGVKDCVANAPLARLFAVQVRTPSRSLPRMRGTKA